MYIVEIFIQTGPSSKVICAALLIAVITLNTLGKSWMFLFSSFVHGGFSVFLCENAMVHILKNMYCL